LAFKENSGNEAGEANSASAVVPNRIFNKGIINVKFTRLNVVYRIENNR
jgi:hypothetical protein